MKDALKMTGRRVYNASVADNPTFPEFIEYIIRTPPNLMDKHWAPYSKVSQHPAHFTTTGWFVLYIHGQFVLQHETLGFLIV